jgi:two-component system response regulator RegX3
MMQGTEPKKILLLEDNLSLIEGLKYFLAKNGFDVTIARTIREARQMFSENRYHLALLDLMLPDGSGFEICRAIREFSNIPILFLTASVEEINVVMGLDLGADDYITKPFKLNELLSRINAALRRSGSGKEQPVELNANGIKVRLLEGRVVKKGEDIELTSMEYRLLCLFMQNPGSVLSKELIMQKLWDCNEKYIDDNTLAVYISRLRDKIEDPPKQPAFLTTVRGMGYRWNVL